MKKWMIISVLAWFSCSASMPDIVQVFYQVNVYSNPQAEESVESLSLFLHVENEDGPGDIEKLYLIHDAEELYWELDTSNWQLIQKDNLNWFGSNAIFEPQGGAFPRGRYEVQVLNKAGDRSQGEFFIDQPVYTSREDLVLLPSYLEGEWIVQRAPELYYVWFYNSERVHTYTYEARSEILRWDEMGTPNLRAQAQSLYFYYYDPDKGTGWITGPFDKP
jgi:hypothetical protein